jgi:uncharacterized protein (DUF433 family)
MIQANSPDALLGFDPREAAAYTYADASRILDVPASTIRAWKKGQLYRVDSGDWKRFEEPIPTDLSSGLSYFDLAEIYVLRSLRQDHRVSLKSIREASDMARLEYGIERLLIHHDFRHDGKELFLHRWDHFASLTLSRQLAFREVLDAYLKRIRYDTEGLTFEFSPVVRELGVGSPKLLRVNPRISFGRPVIARSGVRTAAIVSRLDAGENPAHVREDFDLTEAEFDQAVLLEAA